MPRWCRPPNRKLTWLITLLIGLSVPVFAAAHVHDEGGDTGQAAEHCVLCHVVGQKAAPPPRAGIDPVSVFSAGTRVILDPALVPFPHWHDPASSPRGPPSC